MNRTKTLLLGAASLALSAATAQAATPAPAAPAQPRFDSSTVSGLGARNIGSATMSGRISALVGRVEPSGKTTLLVGSASGGVWKSEDGGTTFRPITDKLDVQSIGAIALDPNHPNTYWVGTGEPWTRNSVSIGDGVYKTEDGGDTWAKMGLPNSERISKIVVDPTSSDTVYACAPGKLWSDSPDRGLYKTTDGGKTWSQVLKGANLSTGCSSIAMDPKDPNHLLAGMWDFRRTAWGFRSGGPNADAPSGSAMMESHDGGRTWNKLDASTNAGLPKGPWGRLAIAFAPSDNRIVYALIEGVRSALFRSDDGGKTWQERDRSQSMVWRPFYFANLVVDPKNPDRLFKPDLSLIATEDGGKSFSNVSGGTHGDHHDIWIDPTNTNHILTGDDGGLWTSYDGGNRWWKSDNLPVSQFYHVTLDDKDPYQVYGGLQDNSSWVGDSAYPGGVTNSRWENLWGGDGFWAWPDPADPEHFAYVEAQGGNIGRVNRTTLEGRDIQPRSDSGEKLRFNWNTPVAISPNEKGTIYIGAQYLFRSRDHGQSWDRISPDLSTNDPAKQKQEESGGITVDNSAAEMHTTIYAISESPKAAGQIWVGTDDGNVQLTRDGGKSWTNLVKNIKGLPAASWVSSIEASRFDPAVAYATFDRHAAGDMDPWVYRTGDYGRSWTRIVAPDQGVRGYAHTIIEDTVKPDLLFLGTEFGLWISADGGKRWAALKGHDFPAVAVRGLAIQPRDSDLVIATHGRGMWVIDDITPLRGLSNQVLGQELAFLPSRPIQQRIQSNGGWNEGDAKFAGDNPATGATITYYQPHRHIFGKLKIEVLDQAGKVVDTLPASKRPGVNRVTWSMRAPAPHAPPAAQIAFASTQGPRFVPGTYTVRITSDGKVYSQPITIVADRRGTYSIADRQAQFDAAEKVSDIMGRMTGLVARINAVREGAEQRAEALPAKDAFKERLEALSAKADVLRKEIVATKEGGAITGEERLREWTDQLYGAINSWDGKPSDYQVKRIAVLDGLLAGVQQRFDALAAGELAATNAELAKRKLEPIALPSAAEQADNGPGGDLHALAGWRYALRPIAAVRASDQGEGERD
jgi:photosystem II stability/assembly factor-like uncharacterized protein